LEFGSGEIGSLEIGATEIRAAQISAEEARFDCPRIAEVSSLKIGPEELSIVEGSILHLGLFWIGIV
jgi:hypothetical protein